MPRRIQSLGNLCLGGKTRRKNYREEKIWGKDGAKPILHVKYFNFYLPECLVEIHATF